MYIYLGIFTFLSFLGIFVPRRAEKAILFFICGLLIIWVGTRYYVGCDFTGYLNRFNNAATPFSDLIYSSKQEISFRIITNLIANAGLSFVWLNVVSAAIIFLCFFFFLKNQFNPLMILALLFPIIIVQLSMSGVRQAIAVGFLLVASIFFIKEKRINCALAILIGYTFHTSVIIFLPIAFLAGRKITLGKLALSVFIVAPILIIILAERIGLYQDRYIEQIYGEQTSGGALLRYILVLVPSLLFFAYKKQLEAAIGKSFGLLKLFALFGVALIPVAFLSSFALHRFSFYIMPFSIVTLIYISHIAFAQSTRYFIRLIPPLVFGIYMLGWFSTSYHADYCYIPYSSYLFRN